MKLQSGLVSLSLVFVVCFGLAFKFDGKNNVSASPGTLTEEIVKTFVTAKNKKVPPDNIVSITFESIQFGKTRTANKADEYEGIPAGETVNPVRVKYSVRRHWSTGDDDKQVYYDYSFYKNNYGEWDALGNGPVR